MTPNSLMSRALQLECPFMGGWFALSRQNIAGRMNKRVIQHGNAVTVTEKIGLSCGGSTVGGAESTQMPGFGPGRGYSKLTQ